MTNALSELDSGIRAEPPGIIDALPDIHPPADDEIVEFRAAVAPKASDRMLSDWIAGVVDRDQDALKSLYDAMIGRVYGLALRITRNAQVAEEVAEDTFWQIWRQAPRFVPTRGTAAAWVMTIARSRALDAVRRFDTVTLAGVDTIGQDVEAFETADAEDPQNLLAATQEGNRLHSALYELDPLPRQLVALAFFRGLTHEEISGHTGLPLGTVKTNIRRALLSLRQALAPNAVKLAGAT